MALKVWLLDFLKYICYRVQTDEEKFLEMWAVRALIKLSKGHIILESLWEFSLFFSFLHSWLNFLINIFRFLGYSCHLLLAFSPFFQLSITCFGSKYFVNVLICGLHVMPLLFFMTSIHLLYPWKARITPKASFYKEKLNKLARKV